MHLQNNKLNTSVHYSKKLTLVHEHITVPNGIDIAHVCNLHNSITNNHVSSTQLYIVTK